MEKIVAIILLNFNNKKLVKNCLVSLRKNTSYKNYKVIISDNGSIDGSNEMIKEKFKWVDLVENGKNLGFAGGNNVGIKYALKKYKSDYYLLLNNDTLIIRKNWLTKLVEGAESDKKIGIVGCKLIYPDGSLQHIGMHGDTHLYDAGEVKKLSEKDEEEAGKIQEVKYVMGAAFLIKRKLIEKIGLLDPKFFPIYGEEIDYCERARKNGFKIFYTPKSTIIHLRSQTTDPKKISHHWFFSKKNSIRLELLNYSPLEVLYWQMIHFGAIFLSKNKGKIRFRKNFVERIPLLIKAYLINLRDIKEILHKRRHRDEKNWD